MLSFKQQNNKSIPLAIVSSSGEQAGEILFLNKGNEDERPEGKKRIDLYDGQFELLPNANAERTCIYISAPSGAGKSSLISKFCDHHQTIFPDRPIVVFSADDDDPVFKDKGFLKYNISELQKNDIIDPNHFINHCVIFDDIDTLPINQLTPIITLQNDILQRGRRKNTSCLSSTHCLLGGHRTKILLTEAFWVVLFPNSGSNSSIKSYFKDKLGIDDKKMIKKILRLPTRWIAIHTRAPQLILTQNECMLMTELETYD